MKLLGSIMQFFKKTAFVSVLTAPATTGCAPAGSGFRGGLAYLFNSLITFNLSYSYTRNDFSDTQNGSSNTHWDESRLEMHLTTRIGTIL